MTSTTSTNNKQEPKVLSAEDIEKALLKSQKRKQLADEKREKNKRKTMERLLKKKDYKANARANKLRPAHSAAAVPMISWRSCATGNSLTFPEGVELPPARKADATGSSVPRVGCAICGEPKRYNCSRTQVPLCSLACYNKQNNIAVVAVAC